MKEIKIEDEKRRVRKIMRERGEMEKKKEKVRYKYRARVRE